MNRPNCGKLSAMEILLLGTGAADGIPNVFCTCQTCADYRDRGELRTPTSILIDDRILVDPGPEAPRQVSRYGRDLSGCIAILAGHAHDDHLDPSLLMHRSWVSQAALDFVGPAAVVELSQRWLDPEQTAVRFTTLTAGDVFAIADYRIEALAASHQAYGEALVYRISDAAASLLYLTDTGLLPEGTLTALTGRRVDLVLLEETFGLAEGKGDQHHNLRTFAQTIADLRTRGVIDDATLVVPIHQGHNNPPVAQLREHLAAIGADVLPDGATIVIPRG